MRGGRCGRCLLPWLLLPVVCWAYEVTDVVDGKLAAEEANHYTIDTSGILIGRRYSDTDPRRV